MHRERLLDVRPVAEVISCARALANHLLALSVAMSVCGQLGCMVRRFRSTSPSSSPLPVACATVHGCTWALGRLLSYCPSRPEHFFVLKLGSYFFLRGGIFSTMASPHRSPVLFLVLATTASPTLASRPLTCADLTVHAGGELQCSSFGGKSHVIELLGAGDSHACQEMAVDPRMPYEISGEVYPRSTCESNVPCPPSVVVCPGNYAGGLHRPPALFASVVICALPAHFPPRILCQLWPIKRYGLVHCAGTVCDLSRGYVGGIPSASLVGAWAPFNATFVPSIDVATVCIMQHGTSSTVVSNLIVRQLVGTPRTSLDARPPARPRISPLPPRRCAWADGSRAR